MASTAASRFATVDEIFSEQYLEINRTLNELHKKYQLTDHADLNGSRFDWTDRLPWPCAYYAARLWEFPFAILSASLRPGLKVADVGCGNTPFTAYLADKVGAAHVTGYDPDYIRDQHAESHSHFGAKESFINALGINFHHEGMTRMTAPDNYYDRVFCISVLEHVDTRIKVDGLREMARILKPGGQLILTFDLGINMPLNNIFNIIQYSGLVPAGCMDLKFPERRFVNYGNNTNVDVFGLVLEKSDAQIYLDHRETEQIPMYRAYDKYRELADFYAVDYRAAMVANDVQRKWGAWRVFVKSLLKKY